MSVLRTSKVVFSYTIFEIFGCRILLFFLPWNGSEWMAFQEFASIFVARNGIPRVYFYFCCTEQNSKLFSLPENGSEQIPRVCFNLCPTERNFELFSLRKSSERNSESFLFRWTARIPSEITICSVYSVFRGIIFFCNSQPYPPPSAPSLMWARCLTFSVFLCVAGRTYWRERGGRRGGQGAKSHDREKAWPSINHSTLSGSPSQTWSCRRRPRRLAVGPLPPPPGSCFCLQTVNPPSQSGPCKRDSFTRFQPPQDSLLWFSQNSDYLPKLQRPN